MGISRPIRQEVKTNYLINCHAYVIKRGSSAQALVTKICFVLFVFQFGILLVRCWIVKINRQTKTAFFSFQVIQKDVWSHGKIVGSVVKLCERLAISEDTNSESISSWVRGRRHEPSQAVHFARALERRWQLLYLSSLEWQYRIERLIEKLRHQVNSSRIRRRRWSTIRVALLVLCGRKCTSDRFIPIAENRPLTSRNNGRSRLPHIAPRRDLPGKSRREQPSFEIIQTFFAEMHFQLPLNTFRPDLVNPLLGRRGRSFGSTTFDPCTPTREHKNRPFEKGKRFASWRHYWLQSRQRSVDSFLVFC